MCPSPPATVAAGAQGVACATAATTATVILGLLPQTVPRRAWEGPSTVTRLDAIDVSIASANQSY